MRGGRGNLGTCLANVKRSQGDDLDKLSCSFMKRSQKGSPSPADMPSWTNQPVADADGKSQDTAVPSSEMKCDQSEVDLLLHSGYRVLQHLKESVGRNSAPAASVNKGSSKDYLAGVSCSIGDALGSDFPGRGPRAPDSRGLYPKGESWVSGWPGHPKLGDMEFLKGELLSAVPEGRGTRSELSSPYSELCQLPCAYAQYDVRPEDKMCVPQPFKPHVFRANSRIRENSLKLKKCSRWSADSHGVTGSAIFQISKSLMP